MIKSSLTIDIYNFTNDPKNINILSINITISSYVKISSLKIKIYNNNKYQIY